MEEHPPYLGACLAFTPRPRVKNILDSNEITTGFGTTSPAYFSVDLRTKNHVRCIPALGECTVSSLYFGDPYKVTSANIRWWEERWDQKSMTPLGALLRRVPGFEDKTFLRGLLRAEL